MALFTGFSQSVKQAKEILEEHNTRWTETWGIVNVEHSNNDVTVSSQNNLEVAILK